MNLDLLVTEYLAAWNSNSDAARLRYLGATWSPVGHFEDPYISLVGLWAMNEYIVRCRAIEPDFGLTLTGLLQVESRLVHFDWIIRSPAGGVARAGFSFAELDPACRIVQLNGHVQVPRSAEGQDPRSGLSASTPGPARAATRLPPH